MEFMFHEAPVEFLEGTTAAGKTTVGAVKFMLRVAESEKQMHILAGLDLGTIEKNIINTDLGILSIFGDHLTYAPSGRGKHTLPHLQYTVTKREKGQKKTETKIIYVLGYDNKTRWKKALGGQYGCLYIDEINVADVDFIREASMRSDYLMGTLNPDAPSLPVYAEYINASRPLERWLHETPPQILEQLNSTPKPGWTHWFFSFKDNLSLTEEKLEQIITNVPVGTKLYKNKIQGLRGRATGLVFSNFDRAKHVMTVPAFEKWFKDNDLKWLYHSCGVDTSYSDKSPDVLAFIFQGITNQGHVIILAEEIYQNATTDVPLAPTDVVHRLMDFLERMRERWGYAQNVFVDSADQATMTELKKYRRERGSIYQFINAYKKTGIIDRIHLQIGWTASNHYLVLDVCPYHIQELESYSWKDDKYEPEDGKDHTINASQYGWLPFKNIIGSHKSEDK